MVTISKCRHFGLSLSDIDERTLSWLASLVVACFVLSASMLPWFRDPLGTTYSAWDITLDMVWFGHTAVLNYGVLCLISAVSIMAIVSRKLRDRSLYTHAHATRWRGTSALFCSAPAALFLFQYLCMDIPAIELLASHKTQQLLIQRHLGYTLPPPLVPLQPFTLTASTLMGRFQLLLAQMSFGPLLLGISACVIMVGWRWGGPSACSRDKKNLYRSRLLVIPALVALGIIVSSALAAMICTYEAKMLLSSGNYDEALHWLSLVNFLNPELAQTADFHIARGQALYFLAPSRMDNDSRVYLASESRSHHDYLSAYHLLLPARQAASPWIVDEMSTTLENLVEDARPLTYVSGKTAKEIDRDRMTLLWLGLLLHVDPTNVYAQYIAARINYHLHNDLACKEHMTRVLHLSPSADIASSAYVYLALSANDVGNYSEARDLLLKAVTLDPDYHNNVAREELSGLH
jgi:hypothetical protein